MFPCPLWTRLIGEAAIFVALSDHIETATVKEGGCEEGDTGRVGMKERRGIEKSTVRKRR